MSDEHYSINVCGLPRDLPLFEVAPKVRIAIFNMLGDTPVVEAIADELARRAARRRRRADDRRGQEHPPGARPGRADGVALRGGSQDAEALHGGRRSASRWCRSPPARRRPSGSTARTWAW